MCGRLMNEHTVEFVNHLRHVARTSLVASAILAVSAYALVIGVLVLILMRSAGPLTLGVLGFLAGTLLTWIVYRRSLRWFNDTASIGQPRRRNQAFVSYRTDEHAEEAELIARTIQRAGMRVTFKKAGQAMVLPDAEGPGARGGLTAETLALVAMLSSSSGARPEDRGSFDFAALSRLFELIGFYQTAGLDAVLHAEIAASDVVVALAPNAKTTRKWWQELRDLADTFLALLLYQCGASPMLWRSIGYGFAYNRVAMRHTPILDLQTWQSWEIEVAKSMDIPVLEVHLSAPDECNASREGYVCRKNRVEMDFVETVLPDVLTSARADLNVSSGTLAPMAVGLLIGACGLAAMSGLVAGLATSVLVLAVRAVI
jgi:hypothetical protein